MALVRDKLREQLATRGIEAKWHNFSNEESHYAEIKALIDEFGENIFVANFTTVEASQELPEMYAARKLPFISHTPTTR